MELIKKEISELEMNIRTHSSLRTHMPELKTLKDLALSTEGELLRMPGFGRKSLNDVKYALKENGLDLGMKQEDLPKDMDSITEEFTYNIIHHAEEAAKKSFDIIVQKKEWNRMDIEKCFNAHERIMFIYKEALERLFFKPESQ